MKLYGAIDLHSNNCAGDIIDDQDRVVYEQQLHKVPLIRGHRIDFSLTPKSNFQLLSVLCIEN